MGFGTGLVVGAVLASGGESKTVNQTFCKKCGENVSQFTQCHVSEYDNSVTCPSCHQMKEWEEELQDKLNETGLHNWGVAAFWFFMIPTVAVSMVFWPVFFVLLPLWWIGQAAYESAREAEVERISKEFWKDKGVK